MFNVENLKIGDSGTLKVKEGASRDGTVFQATLDNIRDCRSGKLFVFNVRLENGEEKWKSFYGENIENFLNGWAYV